jgi:acylphosphatase
MKAVRLIISGRVQGVYFRAFTKKQAIKNSVFGFVSNQDNGMVEVVA